MICTHIFKSSRIIIYSNFKEKSSSETLQILPLFSKNNFTALALVFLKFFFFAELIFDSLIPSLVQFMLVNVIVNGENMGMAIAVLKMATFIMDFGKKTKWMSLDAIGGQIQA